MTPTVSIAARRLLRCALAGIALFLPSAAARAQFTIAENGKTRCVIVRQAGATEAERHAVDELAATLHAITGAEFKIVNSVPSNGGPAIIVGPGPYTSMAAHGEAFIERTAGSQLFLTGGRPRGTVYAVNRFLQDQCGVRWWTPWATDIPRRPTLKVSALNIREEPAFEYREPYWFSALDGEWAAHNAANGNGARLTAALGGNVTYTGGFVHTAYGLVPPSENFATHPEWFSLIDGKRTVDNAQLCLTNAALREYVVGKVREILRNSPDARIISISQNDNVRFCQCPDCAALDAREGSQSGSLIDFVNYVAAKLGPEFPNVAFDTLAYQYTRHPPKTIRPLPNVIVRLCSIECNFGEPFDHPTNVAFYRDLMDWSRICDRLYVWDYTTDFGHYIQPHPNWFTLGANMRIFQQNHVKGVFSEGAYQSSGSEMAEMRAWVLARLMWNPSLDNTKLIGEFLNGYYGRAAAPFIFRYLALIHDTAKGYYLSCGAPTNTPYLDLKTLTAAEKLWQQAESAMKNDPAKLWRIREGHLAVRYVFLSRWEPLRREAKSAGTVWPLPESRKAVADEWGAVATGPGPNGWTSVTHVHEGGPSVGPFLARFAYDPTPAAPVVRLPNPLPPPDIPAASGAIDVQDDAANIFEEGELSDYLPDPKASDGVAVRMPGGTNEWAFQVQFAKLPKAVRSGGKWKVYAVVRVQPQKNPPVLEGPRGDTAAFTAGIWDTQSGGPRAYIPVPTRSALAPGASDEYRSYLLGDIAFTPSEYIWVAPVGNPDVASVWVDRVYLIPDAPPTPPSASSLPSVQAAPAAFTSRRSAPSEYPSR